MQNPQSKWRTDFGRHLIKPLTAFDGIKAIVIAGSVAWKYADEYSDLEIAIFWETLPGDTPRYAMVAALNGC